MWDWQRSSFFELRGERQESRSRSASMSAKCYKEKSTMMDITPAPRTRVQYTSASAFGSGMLLASFRVVRLESVHDLLLVELGAHVEHGAGEAARDFGDLLW